MWFRHKTPMTLDDQIRKLIWLAPNSYRDRTDALDYLFIQFNFFEWRHGALRRRGDTEKPCDIDYFPELEIVSKTPQLSRMLSIGGLRLLEARSAETLAAGRHTRENIETIIRQTHAHGWLMEGTDPDGQKTSFLMPEGMIQTFSKILTLPDDIRPDWLDGAEAALAFVQGNLQFSQASIALTHERPSASLLVGQARIDQVAAHIENLRKAQKVK
jgi:hypothetical protein